MRSQSALKLAETWSQTAAEGSLPRPRPLNLLPVLIRPGQEESVIPQQPVTPRDHVRRNRRIGMTDVRARVDVIDRGSEIKLWLGHVPEPSLAGRPSQSSQTDAIRSRSLTLTKIKLKKLAFFR